MDTNEERCKGNIHFKVFSTEHHCSQQEPCAFRKAFQGQQQTVYELHPPAQSNKIIDYHMVIVIKALSYQTGDLNTTFISY